MNGGPEGQRQAHLERTIQTHEERAWGTLELSCSDGEKEHGGAGGGGGGVKKFWKLLWGRDGSCGYACRGACVCVSRVHALREALVLYSEWFCCAEQGHAALSRKGARAFDLSVADVWRKALKPAKRRWWCSAAVGQPEGEGGALTSPPAFGPATEAVSARPGAETSHGAPAARAVFTELSRPGLFTGLLQSRRGTENSAASPPNPASQQTNSPRERLFHSNCLLNEGMVYLLRPANRT